MATSKKFNKSAAYKIHKSKKSYSRHYIYDQSY